MHNNPFERGRFNSNYEHHVKELKNIYNRKKSCENRIKYKS